jgi:hypothetical protein
VTEFRSAVQNGRLEEALGLYKADLLPGIFVPEALEFEQWLNGERTQLRLLAARAAAESSERLAARRDMVEAIARARAASAFEPASEPMIFRLVTLLIQVGDRTGAAHAWETWQRRLEDEYALTPGADVRLQIESLFAEDAAARHRHTAGAIQPAAVTAQLDQAPLTTTPRWRRRRTRLMLGSALAAAVTMVGVAAALSDNPPLNPRHLLITVFGNETGDAALDRVGRMAADRLTEGLGQAAIVDVLARSSFSRVGAMCVQHHEQSSRNSRALRAPVRWSRLPSTALNAGCCSAPGL